jgi:hypothetical protein
VEYLRSLEEDRKRKEKREEELRAKERAEEEARQQAELEKAMQLSTELARQSKISRVKAAVKPEPQSGADICNVKFQLPSGKKIARNFVKTDFVEVLFRNSLVFYCSSDFDSFAVCRSGSSKLSNSLL